MSAVIRRPCARGFDLGDHLAELVPDGSPGLLQVVELGRSARPPRDVDQLIRAFQQAISFGAYVADVHAAASPRLSRQAHQLVRLGKGGGRIDQGRANPQGRLPSSLGAPARACARVAAGRSRRPSHQAHAGARWSHRRRKQRSAQCPSVRESGDSRRAWSTGWDIDVALALNGSFFISALSGPTDHPSPITSRVTPCRRPLSNKADSLTQAALPGQDR